MKTKWITVNHTLSHHEITVKAPTVRMMKRRSSAACKRIKKVTSAALIRTAVKLSPDSFTVCAAL